MQNAAIFNEIVTLKILNALLEKDLIKLDNSPTIKGYIDTTEYLLDALPLREKCFEIVDAYLEQYPQSFVSFGKAVATSALESCRYSESFLGLRPVQLGSDIVAKQASEVLPLFFEYSYYILATLFSGAGLRDIKCPPNKEVNFLNSSTWGALPPKFVILGKYVNGFKVQWCDILNSFDALDKRSLVKLPETGWTGKIATTETIQQILDRLTPLDSISTRGGRFETDQLMAYAYSANGATARVKLSLGDDLIDSNCLRISKLTFSTIQVKTSATTVVTDMSDFINALAESNATITLNSIWG